MPAGWENRGLPWPWRQVVDSEGPDQGSYSPTESMEQMLIDVDVTNDIAADDSLPGAILGYPDYSAPRFPNGGLRRVLPMQHPMCSRLWAAKIISRRGRPNDRGQLGSKIFDPASGVSYFRYNVWRILIQFGCPPYTVLSDAALAGVGEPREFYRYVEKLTDFSVENIVKKGSRFKWAKVLPTATANGGLPPGETADNTLDFGIILRTGKATLKWIWHQVPGAALFGADGKKVPTNILNAIGKVNDAQFPQIGDFPAGTLLFLPPKFIPEDAPIEPGLAGVPLGYPPRLYKIEMNISFVDPPVDPNWNGVGQIYPFRGHNVQPSPAQAAMPYFYLSTAESSNLPHANTLLYPLYDFNKIFQLPT